MTRKSIETVKWTLQREIDPECSPALVRDQIVTEPLVQSMQHTFTLYGHTGCVNTLNWNHSGTLLASGSDDQQILLWSRGGRLLRRLPTIHTNNIFSVLFVPHTRDHLILSAAGDNQILLHELGQISGDGQQPAHIQRWECGGRVKKLVTCRAEPRLFWSASEDGMLKQFDLRESSSTDFDFSNDHGPLKSLAINESRPEMLAVGLSNPMIPIYDRRNMKEPMMRLIPAHLSLGGSEGRFLATSLAFNEDGNELLANIGSDNIYIFNVIEKQCQVEVFRMLKNFIEEDIKFPLSAKSEQNKANARANNFSSLNGQFLTETNKLADEKEFSRVIDMCSDALISYLEKNNLPADIFPHLLSTVNDENTMRICAKLALHTGPIIHLLATRGQCLKERDWEGDQLDAIRHFLCVLRLFPVHGSVHFNLVKSLYMLKQQELARQCFALYKKLYPEDFSTEQIIRKYEEEKPTQNEESIGPPSWNNESGKRFRDYIGRFTGHLNINTDIKEASWFGAENQYIVSGSDCGSIFIWERKTQKVIRMFKGDNYTVNCVQPHPTSCLIASSGIDNVIRFWEPSPIATKRNVRSKDDPNDREEQNEENEDKDMTAVKYEHMKRNRRRRTPELVWEQLLNSVGLGLFRVDSAQDANDEEDQEPNGDDDAPHVIRCRQM